MPNLEENLRYATTRERRCLHAHEPASGAASLEGAPERVTGILEVKMGGKNMTFAQRVEAVRRGECEPAP